MSAQDTPSAIERMMIGDGSLDAEDMERLKRAREHAADVLRDVEEAPSKGPLKRDLNDNESILAWAVEYQAEVIEGMKGVLKALGTPLSARGAKVNTADTAIDYGPHRLNSSACDQEVADWLLGNLRFFGADEANAHRIVALFIEAINATDRTGRTD